MSSAAEDALLRLRDENLELKKAQNVKDVALRRLNTKLQVIETSLRRAGDGTGASDGVQLFTCC